MKKKMMAIIHIAITAVILGGTLALCGCSGSNFESAVGGGAASSSGGGCLAGLAGCIGSTVSTIACGTLTGCAAGCLGFFA